MGRFGLTRKLGVGLAAGSACLLLFSGTPSHAADKPTTLIVADMLPEMAVSSKAIRWWGGEIEKRSQGRVKFEYYFGASLVGAYEQLTSVKNNVIQVTPYYSAYHPDIAPLPGMPVFPLLNTGTLGSALKAADAWMGNNPDVQAEFTRNNVKYMNPLFGADAFMWSKVPIQSMADFEGLSVRGFGPWLALFKILGSSVVSVPVPEIYNTLERGAVKSTVLYLTNGVGLNLYEVTEYLNTTNLGHHCGMPLVMNLDVWNGLPADIQQIIQEVNREALARYVEMHQQNNAREMKLVADKGMKLNQLPPADVAQLKKIAEEKVWYPYAKKLDEKGVNGTQALEDLIRYVNQY